MIKIDGSVFIQIINFIVLILGLNALLYKPIRGIINKRKEKFNGIGQAIQRSSEDAFQKKSFINEKLEDSTAEGEKKKEIIVKSGKDEEQKIIAAINAKITNDLEEIRNKIKKDVEVVRKSLQNEIDVFANSICNKMLGRVE
ncbi:MAG: ATP synthase F0 subunit B [Desulfobacterales bacterium]|nr:ATP synthase F0 subunit B [Desulfobacterales bacterium]